MDQIEKVFDELKIIRQICSKCFV